MFAICFYPVLMLSTQPHNYSALGLTMAHVAGPQLFSGAPSTITANPAATTLDPKKKPLYKRRRTNDGTSDSAESSSQPPRTRDGPKKKKANRACFHCQKAHLTCDDCECVLFSCFARDVVCITRSSREGLVGFDGDGPLARGDRTCWVSSLGWGCHVEHRR